MSAAQAAETTQHQPQEPRYEQKGEREVSFAHSAEVIELERKIESLKAERDALKDEVGRLKLVKLYAWQPRGHGEYSIFVMAASLDEAKRAADKAIKAATDYTDPNREDRDWNYGEADFDGWGSDYYELTVHEPGAVLFHAND